MRLSRIIALITGLVLASSPFADAANLGISPIAITASPRERSATLTLTNNGDESIRMQAMVFSWSAGASGDDVLVPTKDLIVFPLIFTIDAHKQQRVRSVFNTPATLNERAYRIVLEELPPPVEFNPTGPPHASVTIRSRFSLPVFLQPEKPTYAAKIESASVKSGKLSIAIENTGTAHVKLTAFTVAPAGGGGANSPPQALDVGGIVFAGAHRTISVALPPSACKGSKTLTVTGLANDQKLISTVTVDPGSCQ